MEIVWITCGNPGAEGEGGDWFAGLEVWVGERCLFLGAKCRSCAAEGELRLWPWPLPLELKLQRKGIFKKKTFWQMLIQYDGIN